MKLETVLNRLPNDWHINPLDDLIQFISYGFTNPMPTVMSGVWMITANDINHGQIRYSTARQTSEFAYDNLLTRKSKPIKGDLLLTKDGSLGRVAVVGDEKICINQSVAVIRPNPTSLDTNFLKHLLQSDFYQKEMILNAGGSTIKHIYITIVDKMLILTPPLTEQQKIAQALTDADNYISALEKLIEKKKMMLNGLISSLLKPKRHWINTSIGEICLVIGGGTPSTTIPQFWSGNTPWLTPTEMGKSKYIYDSERKITDIGLKNSSAKLLPINTILLTSRATIGDVAILKIPATTNQGFQSLVCNKHIDPEFVYYLMLTKKDELIKNANGSTFLEITPSKIKEINLSIPPTIEEQVSISKQLKISDEDILTSEKKLQKAYQIKQGMMQKLLTGEIRLA